MRAAASAWACSRVRVPAVSCAVVLVDDADGRPGEFLGGLLLALEHLALDGRDQEEERREDEQDDRHNRGQHYAQEETAPRDGF